MTVTPNPRDETARPRAEVARLLAEVERLRADLVEAERRADTFALLAAETRLTGPLNRRGLPAELTRAVAHVSRYRTGVALLPDDLDRFKPVTDRRGQRSGAGGDQAMMSGVS